MWRTIWILAAFNLAGCTVDEIEQARQAMLSGGCPPLVEYDKPFQKAAAAQLRKLGPDDPLVTLIADYKKMRDACRAGGA